MSDLSSVEKLKIEKLFGMSTGYVLDFSNRSFSDLVLENTGIEILNAKYEHGSSSKANRLRKFWQIESNVTVGQLLTALLVYWKTQKQINHQSIEPEEQSLYDDCLKIAERLSSSRKEETHRDNSATNSTSEEIQKRPLKVFLCHASDDKADVKALYDYLIDDGVDAWLDKEKLLPGQDWRYEIQKAVREADVVIVCHSKSFNREGFRQREVRWALDIAMEKPEGEIFIIPARLEKCDMLDSLKERQWVDLFEEDGYERLMRALHLRAASIDATLRIKKGKTLFDPPLLSKAQPVVSEQNSVKPKKEKSGDVQSSSVDIGGNVSDSVIVMGNGNVINMGKQPEILQKKDKLEHEIAEVPVIKEPSSLAGAYLAHAKKSAAKAESSKPGKPVYKPIKTEYIIALIGAVATIIAGILSSPLTGKWVDLLPEATITPSPTLSVNEFIDSKDVRMVFVQGGEFKMGSDTGDLDEKPVHKVYLDSYLIDKYEVTNALYKNCVDAGICNSPVSGSSETHPDYYSNPDYNNYPVVNVNWSMANIYCSWREARLPTEAEWELAARGTDNRTYPWGEGVDKPYANYGQILGDTTEVGHYEQGKSI